MLNLQRMASHALGESLALLGAALGRIFSDALDDALLESALDGVSALQSSVQELLTEGELPAQVAFFR